MSNLRPLPAPPPRLSAKLRRAIDLRVRKCLSIADACHEAGLSTAGWFKAMKRRAVREHMDEVQHRFIAEADTTRAVLRVRALQVAADLLETAQSEAVKVRLVEFLLSEGKTPQVAVNVDARAIQAPVGYAYPSWPSSGTNPSAALDPILGEPDSLAPLIKEGGS